MSDINLRPIRIAGQILMGAECARCPGAPAIYPATLLPAHMDRHDVMSATLGAMTRIEHKVRYRGGRKAGPKNRRSMSSSGIEKKSGIQNGR